MKKTPTKKTSNHTSSRSTPNAPASTAAIDLNSDLPIIRIVSEEEEMHVKMELEMEDETHDMLVKWGKEVASDEDYIRIALDAGIREAVDALDNKQE